MTLLLDTHAIIWFLDGSPLLSENARTAILNPNNERLVSVASVWELSIKSGLGKFSFDGGMSGFLKLLDVNGFDILPISVERCFAPPAPSRPFRQTAGGSMRMRGIHIGFHRSGDTTLRHPHAVVRFPVVRVTPPTPPPPHGRSRRVRAAQ